jgi:hypothetical protein
LEEKREKNGFELWNCITKRKIWIISRHTCQTMHSQNNPKNANKEFSLTVASLVTQEVVVIDPKGCAGITF